MKVTVKLLGALGDLASHTGNLPIDFTLPDGATATELVTQLAARFGEPFADPDVNTAIPKSGIPSRLQLFVNGEFSPKPDRRLAAPGAPSATVQIVIMKPVTGG